MHINWRLKDYKMYKYCRGQEVSIKPPSGDETQSVKPLVLTFGAKQKSELQNFVLDGHPSEPGTPQYIKSRHH